MTDAHPVKICESDFPLNAPEGRFALAVITGVEGPSYRPRGAAMLIDASGQTTGSLSSGCVEGDVVLRAQQAMASGQGTVLRYGRGSPFIDITLPCGGGLDIGIVPNPDRSAFQLAAAQIARRESARLDIAGIALVIQPQVRFLVFGKGPEAAYFARLAHQAGYPTRLFSPDPETLSDAGFGDEVISTAWPESLKTDARTAVTVFYHDHDREPPILAHALSGPAFYVGAQGSLRAHLTRCDALRMSGVTEVQIARLASPFGLIPSTRDARTLAVSVLADVLSRQVGKDVVKADMHGTASRGDEREIGPFL